MAEFSSVLFTWPLRLPGLAPPAAHLAPATPLLGLALALAPLIGASSVPILALPPALLTLTVSDTLVWSSPELACGAVGKEKPAVANEPKSPEETPDWPASAHKRETNGEANEESAAAVTETGATKRVSPGVGPEAALFVDLLLARLF